MTTVYRRIAPEEHAVAADIVMLGFGSPAEAAAYQGRTDPADLRLLEDGGVPVAAARLAFCDQWWLGGQVGSAQVRQLVTAPEHRSLGHAVALLRGVLSELHELGRPTATLFASSYSLYRKAGFECAGTWTGYNAKAEHLPRRLGSFTGRRLAADDMAEVKALYGQLAPGRHGAIVRDDKWWRALRGTSDPNRPPADVVAFLLEGPEGPAGWAFARFSARLDERGFDLSVVRLLDHGCVPGAEPAVLALLAGYGTIEGEVHWSGPVPDPLVLGLDRPMVRVTIQDHFLLRLVDVAAAVATRPFPAGVDAAVSFSVDDPMCPWNSGSWRLEVAGGRGRLERVAGAEPVAHVRGLAALFSGFLDPRALAGGGLLTGFPDAGLGSLETIFASPTPWVTEHW